MQRSHERQISYAVNTPKKSVNRVAAPNPAVAPTLAAKVCSCQDEKRKNPATKIEKRRTAMTSKGKSRVSHICLPRKTVQQAWCHIKAYFRSDLVTVSWILEAMLAHLAPSLSSQRS